ncbi:lazarillo protein-like [Neocloeon triangulifer]|uniref:lazarillo protein-like n=1 Tax=Neocloeon triangulifer TaxID=2078957 RepID=UPI00286FAEEF|nr:lazarillo protein-like [Neocloeon triangulifer]
MIPYILVALFVAAVNSQIVTPGNCPQVTVVGNFSLELYLDRWYQYSSYPGPNELGRCDYVDYYDNSFGNVAVFEATINNTNNQQQFVTGRLEYSSSVTDGKLLISYPLLSETRYDYWVLGVDYASFAVVFSCSSDGVEARQNSWVITREQYPSPEVLNAVQDVIDQNGLPNRYVNTVQTDCVPFIPPGQV